MRFGFTGVSLFVLSASSPSPHSAPYHLFSPRSARSCRADPRIVTRPIARKREDRPRHAVCERDRDDLGLLGRQLARQPVRSRVAAPAPDHDPRHRPKIEQTPDITIAHLRDTTAPRLAAGRMLLWRQAEPEGAEQIRKLSPTLWRGDAAPAWPSARDRFARCRRCAAPHSSNGLPVAHATQGLPTLFDGSRLLPHLARQRALAEHQPSSRHGGA